MKIGTLTFHWANNYGAVLQAYALQKHLVSLGHDAVVIDYFPHTYSKRTLRSFVLQVRRDGRGIFPDYIKGQKIESFRRKYLRLSRRYSSIQELRANPPELDAYICGSDQIWNTSFTRGGEGHMTLSYFLDFGSPNVKRIAYAPSFGCTRYPLDLMDIVKEKLGCFDAISAREASGLQILKSMGLEKACLVTDPTLLLSKSDYEDLLQVRSAVQRGRVFVYALHRRQNTIQQLARELSAARKWSVRKCEHSSWSALGIEEWLREFSEAEAVVTNSFHGIVFAILFEKSFVAVPVEGALEEMNDRIFTLLGQFNLQDRIVDRPDREAVERLLTNAPSWVDVRNKKYALKEVADAYLSRSLLA